MKKQKITSKEEIEFEQWSEEKFCLKAVERNGDALQYVKDQTESICLKAVEQDGDALQYVKERKIWESCRIKRKR